jgi:hypothetical protein
VSGFKGFPSTGFALLALIAACAAPEQDATPEPQVEAVVEHNTLTDMEREAGWVLLFDGETMIGWRSYYDEGLPAGWRVEDGMLHRFDGGGDLVSSGEYSSFELSLDWKVAEAGNSGIFYLAALGSDAIWESAPEMQVLDDEGHPDGQSPLTSAGANYGLYAAPRGVVKAAGEWNHARIVVDGEHVEHWLNGVMVVEYELGSEEWDYLVASTKFAEWPEYGTARSGHIGLQDHGDPVWYRNIKIRATVEP